MILVIDIFVFFNWYTKPLC